MLSRLMSSTKQTFGRFIVVGLANTMLDFGLLFILKAFGLPATVANIISSTIAFLFSFIANKKYTFRTTGTKLRRELILFTLVTLFGLWVLQTPIIACWPTLDTVFHNPTISLIAAKLIATAVTMTWNFILYSRVVFIHNKEGGV